MLLKISKFSPTRNLEQLFDPIDIELSSGEIVCILGPSGKGKTSIFESVRNKCDYKGVIELSANTFSVWQKS